MRTDPAKLRAFRKLVLLHYKTHGRHTLPWRKTTDPYRILISEVMLQQTQVDRVIPFYQGFLKAFPTPKRLAGAPLSQVLTLWQGLGYNRRAKMLQNAAKEIASKWKGRFPRAVEEIESLPGVGPYTARAVAAFAFNTDSIFIETNIRAVVIHHFFSAKKVVSDDAIREVLTAVYPKGSAREWYSALMDYGAALKRQGIRTNARVKGYTKQQAFDGSLRQARGAILRALATGPLPTRKVTMLLGLEREEQMKGALASLVKEEMVELREGRARLPGSAHPVPVAKRKRLG